MGFEHSLQRGSQKHRASVSAEMSQDEWMNPRQTAAHVNSSTSTLAKKRLKGDGPPYTKFGRLVLYRRADVDEYLARRRRLSTSGVRDE